MPTGGAPVPTIATCPLRITTVTSRRASTASPSTRRPQRTAIDPESGEYGTLAITTPAGSATDSAAVTVPAPSESEAAAAAHHHTDIRSVLRAADSTAVSGI